MCSIGKLSSKHLQVGNNMTAAIGFPLGTVYRITDISRSFPGVVTLEDVALAYSFAVANGQTVTISKLRGMLEVNDNRYIVTNFNAIAKTFEMYDLKFNPVDTRNFVPYESGGQINIISYPGTPPGLMYNNQGI